jgi:glutathione S-transferase
MFFEQYDHEPAIAVVRFWRAHVRPPNSGGSTGRFRRIGGGASDPDGGTASGASAGRPEAFADRLEERTTAGHRALAAMERHLEGRSFLVGDGMTLADIALYAYTHVADEGGFDLGAYPAIRRWLERVAAQPGHVAMDA